MKMIRDPVHDVIRFEEKDDEVITKLSNATAMSWETSAFSQSVLHYFMMSGTDLFLMPLRG